MIQRWIPFISNDRTTALTGLKTLRNGVYFLKCPGSLASVFASLNITACLWQGVECLFPWSVFQTLKIHFAVLMSFVSFLFYFPLGSSQERWKSHATVPLLLCPVIPCTSNIRNFRSSTATGLQHLGNSLIYVRVWFCTLVSSEIILGLQCTMFKQVNLIKLLERAV